MSGLLNIRQGGRIRYNLPTNTTTAYKRGQAIVVNAFGQLEILAAQGSAFVGIAGETCLATGSNNALADTNTVIAGQQGSIYCGEAIVETDNLSGTGGWEVGVTNVWAQAGGNFGQLGAGVLCGKALSDPASNGRLTFFFRANLSGL